MGFFTQHNVTTIFPSVHRVKRKTTSIVLKAQNQLTEKSVLIGI